MGRFSNITAHRDEPHRDSIGGRLNWLRAGVLGANDGIVSVAGTVIGVAGATPNTLAIAVAGLAAIVAGAFSMAGGEYVSVSTQRDTERALIDKERWELETMPDEELSELAGLYQAQGLSRSVAETVAQELTAHDALKAHATIELGLDPDEYTNPWTAAGASFLAFSVGALVPFIIIVLPLPDVQRVIATIVGVAVALLITGAVSARLGGAASLPAIVRNVGMGLITMAVTFGVGSLFGSLTA